ncbi:MAG TPA: hypothetical protein VF476_08210 [Chitinophagaceae bacterium]
MLKQLRHKRFSINRNDTRSSLSCYCYAQALSIVPVGNEKDNSYQRPDHIRT